MTKRRCSAAGLVAAGVLALSGCDGSVLVGGVSFTPWLVCVAAGALVAYVLARVLEARLFAYDPRYFVWTFLALTTLCAIALWALTARPPPG